MFNFEKLDVWHKSVDLAKLVYELTTAFPAAELYGLTSQMRRAVVSISSNIAEGASRNSVDDHARFLEIATGSLFELVSQSALALRMGLINADQHHSVYTAAEEQSRMLSGLRKAILHRRS
jgi:four helix bundle protein